MIRKRLLNRYVLFIIIFALLLTAIGCNQKEEPIIDQPTFSFEELQREIDIDRAMGYIRELVDFGPRMAGLRGEREAGDYLVNIFEDLSLSTNDEEFPVLVFEAINVELSLKVVDSIKPLKSNILTYSTSTPHGGLNNLPLVYGGLGKRTELTTIDFTNSIAVVHRGDIYLREKVLNCANKGAEAVIIINTDDAPIMATLIDESPIPAIAVSSSEGEKIIEALKDEATSGNLIVETTIEAGNSNNVIGVKKSSMDTSKILIIGAHYDSVNTSGANDNASGVGGLLEIATILKDVDLPFDIHYIAFGSEEVGLVGSNYHALTNYLEGRSNVIGMINLDMIGMGDYLSVNRENSHSSDFLSNIALAAALDLNLKTATSFSGRSDHSPFENLLIPVVFLAYGPLDPYYYHTEFDTFDTLDPQLIKNTIEVVLKTIVTLANNN